MTIMTRARCAAGLLVALGPGDTAITERGGATATQRGTGAYDGPSLNPQNPNGRKGRVGPELGRMDAEPQGSREGRGGDGLESRGKHGAGTAAEPRSGGAAVSLRRQTRRRVAQQRDRARGRRARHGIKGKTRGTVYVPKWQDVASHRSGRRSGRSRVYDDANANDGDDDDVCGVCDPEVGRRLGGS